MAEKMATREAYGLALAELGEKHLFYVCDADLSKATRTEHFAKKYPERFFNIGISEGDMMSTAAGMSTCGSPVFASTFAMFAAGRAYDAVRNSIAYPHRNVKICATHAGILINEDGASHQCVEDIALMRVIPEMVVIVPTDAKLTKAAVEEALLYDGPVYIRLGGKYAEELVYDTDISFKIGKGMIVREGTDATIMAVGRMLYQSLLAADMLKAEGISARVVDMSCIKPMDEELVVRCAKETGVIVTAEDHSVIGGLGGAVAEVVSEAHPTVLRRVGVKDKFGMSGSFDEMVKIYGLDAETIFSAVKDAIKAK
ncbi:transketolase C-terminal domain-containing protein [Petroclostridium sp. X23]|uniref:transketolase family protein n=1 Tax=Petroclostridium sp. X23 TaxID=3045146 RepID=UPI0024AE020E|nr:transketolase C-terminal domain-containing protein [Petroclostridium sp. X23]WHH60818.1 transketolase C-terminal domain-containing protein [Petroclostridium sp. X23]